MTLRRLSLFGFKSFAETTELEFSPGITAIVGPNGSGKSNTVDALLWVLGERGRRILRTQQPTEVIFAGSRLRPPMNVAEVSVTFDNSQGWLPLDLTEVTLTRRLDRSGESEFFINRRPCRLRDIEDLFLDTGIGKHSYSFLTQNELDLVLSLSPQERRSLFDEAAGINKYRHRKEEALRRLEETERNLVRLGDLMHGLEMELEPLAEQVEVAQRYQALHARIQQLQRGLLLKDYDLLQRRLERSRAQEEALEREQAQAEATLARLEAAEQQTRQELAQKEDSLEQWRQALLEVGRKVERAQGEVALLKEREQSLARRERELAARWEEARERRQALLQARAKREEESQARQTLREALLQEQQALEERIASLGQELQAADAQTALRRSTLLHLVEACSRLQGQIQQREAWLRDEERQEAQRQQRLRRLREAEEEAWRAEEAEALRRQEAEAALLQAIEAAQKAEEAVGRVEGQRRDLQEQRAALQAELSHLMGRLRALREMEARYEGYQNAVRRLLQARDRGELQGTYAPVAEWLQVSPGYERAIEAALGGRLQNIVTATAEEALQAIAYLKAQRAGRATFLPLDLLRPSPPLPPMEREPGVVGRALDLVRYPPPFEPAAHLLLGRFLVVENWEAALRLRRQGAHEWTMVTLEGDLLLPHGAMVGGSEEGQRMAFLSRRRELAELEGFEEVLKARLAEKDETLARLQEEEKAARRRWQEARRHLEEARRRRAEAEQRWLQARHRREQCQRERQQEEQEQAAQEEERRKVQARQREQQEEWKALEARRAEEEARLSEEERSLLEKRRALEELQQHHAALRLRLAEEESAERRAQLQRHQEEMALLELERACSRMEEEHRQILREREAIRRHLQEKERDLAQGLREQKALEERLAGERTMREGLLAQVGAIFDQLKKAQATLHDIEAQRHRLALQRTQTEGEVEHILRELKEHHGLTVEEARAQTGAIPPRAQAVEELQALREQVAALGPVNLGAPEEYRRIQGQLQFYAAQRADLEKARSDLLQTIAEIDRQTRSQFLETLAQVEGEFQALCQLLFGPDTQAQVLLTEPEKVLESGIEILLQLPGRRLQNLLLLSKGERALAAIALLFAFLRVKPSPFCVLDEVDAPLDDANVERFCRLVREFSSKVQFILITHNKLTMEMADVLYGITMQEDGVSTVLSVELVEAEEAAAGGG